MAEKREHENVTQFTMRLLRDGGIDACLKVVDSEFVNLSAGFGWGAWTEQEYQLMNNVLIKIKKGIEKIKET